MSELWNQQIVEKSQKILEELKGYGDFVLIGGWATYLLGHGAKSKDIDVYVDFSDFFQLQKKWAADGVNVRYNGSPEKYEIEMDGIEIDIYTPENKKLIVPPKDVFADRMYKVIEGFKCILPEPLLVLKLHAEEDRPQSIKGLKDRIDILTLLVNCDIDYPFLDGLFERYQAQRLRERLATIVKKSNEEFKYLYKSPNLREIKKLKGKVISALL